MKSLFYISSKTTLHTYTFQVPSTAEMTKSPCSHSRLGLQNRSFQFPKSLKQPIRYYCLNTENLNDKIFYRFCATSIQKNRIFPADIQLFLAEQSNSIAKKLISKSVICEYLKLQIKFTFGRFQPENNLHFQRYLKTMSVYRHS